MTVMEVTNYKNYYIRVRDTMLPRPTPKQDYIMNYGERLPIITVECEI
jgi:hypothetical protein